VKDSSSHSDIEAIVTAHSDQSAKDLPIDNIDHINEVFTTEGSVHDLFARLKNSDSDFARGVEKKLRFMSPLSMGVTYE
jgi:hypothetical protein